MESLQNKVKSALEKDYGVTGDKNMEVYKEVYASYLSGLKAEVCIGQIDLQNQTFYLLGREYIADASKVMRKLKSDIGLELKLHILGRDA